MRRALRLGLMFPHLALSLGLSLLAVATSAQTGQRAYVPNEEAGSISVIDTDTDRVLETWNVGGKPRGIAVSRDGSVLWISDKAGNAVHRHDARTSRRLRTLPLGESPEGIALSHDGR